MIVSLQYLRGIAAMMVVAFHAGDVLAKMNHPEESMRFMVGLAGVDIFFVISGFIMWVMAERTDLSPVEFLRKRLIRIVPLYWFLTLLVTAVAITMPHLLSTTEFDPAHFMASLFFFPWQHPRVDAMLPVVIPGWTLNYEMTFYAIFALGLLLPRARRFAYLLVSLTALPVLGLILPDIGVAAFYTNPIILEFAAGVIIAKLWTSGFRLRSDISLLVMLAGFVLLYAGVGSTLPRILCLGIPSALIVAGTMFPDREIRTPALRPLGLLGDASYSIYLSQIITLPVVAKLWTGLGLTGVGVNGGAFLAVGFVSCAVAGILLYLLVERQVFLLLNGKPGQSTLQATPLATPRPTLGSK